MGQVEFYALVLASLGFFAIPGATIICLVNGVLVSGFRTIPAAVAAATLGNVLYLIAAVTGISALAATSHWLLVALQWAGLAFLLWLSWKTWIEAPAASELDPVETRAKGSIWSVFHRVLLVNLLNPKNLIFWTIVLSHFSGAAMLHRERLIIVLAIILSSSIVTYTLYGLLAGRLSAVLRTAKAQRISRRIGAAFLFLLAIAMAVYFVLDKTTLPAL